MPDNDRSSQPPSLDAVREWVEKAYEGAHTPVSGKGTPVGEARAEPLKEYWTHGKGALKIRWGTPGDFDRCVRQVVEHAHMIPEQAKGYCNLLHHRALGIYPATHAKLEREGEKVVKKDDSLAEQFARVLRTREVQ